MQQTRVFYVIVAIAACAVSLIAQNVGPPPLAMSTGGVPEATLRSNYYFQLQATGGALPLRWTITTGSLPPGISLDENSGVLAGVPTAPGSFNFQVLVTDSTTPPQKQQRELLLLVVPALIVNWKQVPEVSGGGIYGSVDLDCHLPEEGDLTFIVVAVNEIGKAFALGYQHYRVEPGSQKQELTFGSTLPAGSYIVHVDVVAELPATYNIYRTRVQTSVPLTVTTTP